MSITTEHVVGAAVAVAALICGCTTPAQNQNATGDAATPAYGFGQPATPTDLARFFSSLPDGTDLPKGFGTVAEGKAVYEAQCAACHGENLQGGLGDRLVGGRGTLV